MAPAQHPTICYIHQYFRTPEMSGGTRSYEIARRLVQAGNNVIMLTSAPPGSTIVARGWQQTESAGIKVFWYGSSYRQEFGFWRRMFAYIGFTFAACCKAGTLKMDLVYASSTPLTIGAIGIVLKLFRQVPFVFEVRDVWPAVPIAMNELRSPILICLARWLEKLTYHCADHIIALSPDMRRDICRTGISPEKVTVVPNGSDTSISYPPNRTSLASEKLLAQLEGRRFLIYAGTLGRVNAVSYLARLAEQLAMITSELCVVAVGSGAEQSALESEARRRGVLGSHLYIFPPLKKLDLPNVLTLACAGISTVANIPALAANSANKVFDYFASGLPVLINHNGWLADVILKEQCGLVLTPACGPQDAIEIVSWIGDADRYGQSRANALRVARETFSRDSQFLTIQRIVAECMQCKSRVSH